MSDLKIAKPQPGEFAPYYGKYIDLVPDGDAVGALAAQIAATSGTLRAVSGADSLKRYAAGKWSIREVLGHLTDAERVFAYRALRFARGDATPLPGFDENAWVPSGNFAQRSLADLTSELEAVRGATIALVRGLDESVLTRRGVANGAEISVRALLYIIAGHERHHVKLLKERYSLS
jgi:uncharacterized damage-inducible protein DinB